MVHYEARRTELTPDQLEAGRLLFAGQCDFIAAANNMPALPPITLPEVCFAGIALLLGTDQIMRYVSV